ncbi:MAG: zinc-binding dehydrogenase [Opitutaceae bacterium]|jgi:2-desacetyl-2-hydroxyethyl bacteriochlorophyllide A dehydrogenase|nr:zinc-binding dehydrogenase [Opitutaceae bacterium]
MPPRTIRNTGIITRAIVMERPLQAAFRDIRLTPLTPGSILCRTTLSAISSGTDMKTWRGEQHPEQCWFPLVPGYENVGIVEEIFPDETGMLAATAIAPGATPLRVGDRVMINECRRFADVCASWGGNARHVIKNATTATAPFDYLAKIPDNVSDADASLAYLACVALKGIRRFTFAPDGGDGETVVVTGAGILGLSALQILKNLAPAATLIAIDQSPTACAAARHYADHALVADGSEIPKLREITNGRMAGKLLECTGSPRLLANLYRYIKDGGWRCDGNDEPAHIHLQGDYPGRVVLDNWHRWFVKNCKVTMTCAYAPGAKEQILAWMSAGKFTTRHFLTKIRDAADCHAAYAGKQKNPGDNTKILFRWD